MKAFFFFISSYFVTFARGVSITKAGSSIDQVKMESAVSKGTEFEQDSNHASLVKRHHHDCGYAVVPVYQPGVCSYCDDHHDHHHHHC